MLTQNGSIPAAVMRTGVIQPISPANARQDLDTQHVLDVTLSPVNAMDVLPPARPSDLTTAVAQTVTATPPAPIQAGPLAPLPPTPSGRTAWHIQHRRQHPAIEDIKRLHPRAQLHGAAPVQLGEWAGRPVAKFEIAASPPKAAAGQAAQALRRAAHELRATGLSSLPPELVGGPLAALMRGGAVELHFRNDVVIRTAL